MKSNHIYIILIISIFAGLSLSGYQAEIQAHCQVPCGIYDDHARVLKMLEDVNTIQRATDSIVMLSKERDAHSQNQIVRWVNTKEAHAENIISTISDYFLTQRVKPSQEDYVVRLKKHHAVILNAMKVKQNLDNAIIDQLKKDVESLLEYYPKAEK